jgi:hypothetical protein
MNLQGGGGFKYGNTWIEFLKNQSLLKLVI